MLSKLNCFGQQPVCMCLVCVFQRLSLSVPLPAPPRLSARRITPVFVGHPTKEMVSPAQVERAAGSGCVSDKKAVSQFSACIVLSAGSLFLKGSLKGKPLNDAPIFAVPVTKWDCRVFSLFLCYC